MERRLALSIPLFGMLIALLCVAVLPGVMHARSTPVLTSQLFQDVARDAQAGGSPVITAVGNDLTAAIGHRTLHAVKSSDDNIYGILRDYNVPLARVRIDERDPSPIDALRVNPVGVLTWLVVLGMLFFVLGEVNRRGRNRFSLPRPTTRRFSRRDRPTIGFADVAGTDEAKGELSEVVEFLKKPERFALMGATVPRGVLLAGPPGCGKTLLARAAAGEAHVPFYAISGSEFMEMFVGVGASRVRALFARARRHAPCIIFIDEIDAIGRKRGHHAGGGNEEREHTLNQILVEMDGFDSSAKVVVVAATNRPDVLDEALLRPGRFDRQVTVGLPDVRGREAVLRVHAAGKPLGPDVDLGVLARQTAGFSGADLMNLMNEGAILAVRRSRTCMMMSDLEDAIDRVLAGPERESHLMGEEERRVTAYHEVGHALVARVLPQVDDVHKISIISRGRMGGYTRLIPRDERQLYTRSRLMGTLAWCLGGRAAEDLVFGEMSSGASSDIERATDIARRMVCEFGMSERLGPVLFARRDADGPAAHSEALSSQVDREIQAIIGEADTLAREIVRTHQSALHASTEVLMREETIDSERFAAIFASAS